MVYLYLNYSMANNINKEGLLTRIILVKVEIILRKKLGKS